MIISDKMGKYYRQYQNTDIFMSIKLSYRLLVCTNLRDIEYENRLMSEPKKKLIKFDYWPGPVKRQQWKIFQVLKND